MASRTTPTAQVANIIFLESPAFVGWSYSNSTEDRTVGDKRTAEDALAFLEGFFKRFPELRSRPLWLAGESYGGVRPYCAMAASDTTYDSWT